MPVNIALKSAKMKLLDWWERGLSSTDKIIESAEKRITRQYINARTLLDNHRSFRLISRIAILASGIFATIFLISLIPEKQDIESVWAVYTIDAVVLYLIAFYIISLTVVPLLVIALLGFSRSRSLLRALLRWGAALVLLATLYVAYASFRNQSRLAAENALNENGAQLLATEFEKPELRCLYGNYGNDDWDKCLNNLVIDKAKWSLAIFYVEEAWFSLEKANEDRSNWGAKYADDIKYWADDVAEDPTGLFTYYQVAINGLEGARKEIAAAGIDQPLICTKYLQVWDALAQHGELPPEKSQHLTARRCRALLPLESDAQLVADRALFTSTERR